MRETDADHRRGQNPHQIHPRTPPRVPDQHRGSFVADVFIGTEGWVGNRGWRGKVEASSPEIMDAKIEEIHLYTNPEGEHRDFLDCVKSRKDPYFPVDIGHRVSTVCHLANIAIKLGRKLKWNPVAEEFENDEAANAMRSRPMRSPWTLS